MGIATYIALCVTPDKGHNDDALVPALILVHSVHLHSSEGFFFQQSGDSFELLPVWSDDPDVTCPAAGLKHQ